MTIAVATSWFLTPSGWRSTEDPVAVWDAEVWPAGTLVAGILEWDEIRGRETWVEHWRDRWNPQEVGRATTQFGTIPMRQGSGG
jgi:hypothetical protein